MQQASTRNRIQRPRRTPVHSPSLHTSHSACHTGCLMRILHATSVPVKPLAELGSTLPHLVNHKVHCAHSLLNGGGRVRPVAEDEVHIVHLQALERRLRPREASLSDDGRTTPTRAAKRGACQAGGRARLCALDDVLQPQHPHVSTLLCLRAPLQRHMCFASAWHTDAQHVRAARAFRDRPRSFTPLPPQKILVLTTRLLRGRSSSCALHIGLRLCPHTGCAPLRASWQHD